MDSVDDIPRRSGLLEHRRVTPNRFGAYRGGLPGENYYRHVRVPTADEYPDHIVGGATTRKSIIRDYQIGPALSERKLPL